MVTCGSTISDLLVEFGGPRLGLIIGEHEDEVY